MERFEQFGFPCPIYLSGDHNPNGIQSLLDLLQYYSWNTIHILVGIGKDKNLEGILAPLFTLRNSKLYLTETPFKSLSINAYGKWTKHSQGCWNNPIEGLEHIQNQAKQGDLILVTGSLYLVGLLRNYFHNHS